MEPVRRLIEYLAVALPRSEAPGLPEAERIPGSMLLREVVADDFPDTGPDVHPVSTEPQANSVSLTPVAS